MALADRPAEEQIALAYCAPHGIPLSVFLGRTVYPGEPLWLPEDTDAAVDWMLDQNDRCPGCGQPHAETTSPDAQGEYVVDAKTCHCCLARIAESKTFQDRGDDMGAIYFRTTRRADDDT